MGCKGLRGKGSKLDCVLRCGGLKFDGGSSEKLLDAADSVLRNKESL